MEDTIEVCSGCGKMPRPIDYLNGQFLCSRCGNSKTQLVSSEEYEDIVTELDRKFHSKIIETRVAFVREENPSKKRKTRKKPAKKAKARKPAKKRAAKKKAKRKPARKKASKKRRR